jgi:NodT family efflux transporter outer membrane factor (OMF) lipoprotein
MKMGLLRCLLACGVAALGAGCAAPVAQTALPAVHGPASLGLAQIASMPLAPRWWEAFGDVELNRLMSRALHDSPDIAQAGARLQRAMAMAALQGGGGLNGALEIGVTRQRYSENGLLPAPLAGAVKNTGHVTASLTWAPDWSGLQAAELAAAVGESRAARADVAAASSVLSSRIVQAYIGLARLQAQHEVLSRLLVHRIGLLKVVRERVVAGLDSRVESSLAEGAVPEARADLLALDEQMVLTRRQLAVLSGQAPQACDALSPVLSLLAMEGVPATLGADLLGRPDIVAARWRVESAAVEAARARFLPNLRLSAFVGLQALGLNHLLDLGRREMGVTPALSLPLFERDRLVARLSASRAAQDEAIAAYNGVLLRAVREAGDALASGQSLARQAAEQASALAFAEATWALERYRAGLTNLLPVLESESRLLAQRRQAHELRARSLNARASLMVALGGGWTDDTSNPGTGQTQP